MPPPPCKRRRLDSTPTVYSFLDLEAEADKRAEEDETEQDADDFIDDTEPGNEATDALYSRPLHLAAEHEEEEGDDERYGGEQRYWEHDPEVSTYTQGFMRRIGGPSEGFGHDDERRAPVAGDGLWEIGCKIGAEEEVVFEIGTRFIRDSTSRSSVCSVIGRKTLPGRIYVEASSHAKVLVLAQTVDELSPAKIRKLGYEELLPVLLDPKPIYRPQTWRRILGPWKDYKGDIALVVELEEQLFIIAVPRILLYSSRITGDRPPQKLFKRDELEEFVGYSVLHDEHGAFRYNGRDYMPEGYFIEFLHKARLSDEVVPSLDELNSFLDCIWLERKTYERTAVLISQANIKVHDRIKVISGNFINLVGQVVEVSEHELEIYLPSQDANEKVLREDVRHRFAIGDEVRLLGGQHKGLTAWVVGVAAGEIKVLNLERNLEATISPEEAEFYDSPHLATLRIRKPPANKAVDPATIDPHQKYVGRQVMATGSVTAKNKHPYKGYVGIIKTTSPDGTVCVELQALQQKVVKFDLDDLRLWSPYDKKMDPEPIRTSKHFLNMPVGPSGFAELPNDFVARKPQPPPDNREVTQPNPYLLTPVAVVSTPAPTSSPGGDVSPAWDPSSQTPRTPVVAWLSDPLIMKARVKVMDQYGDGKVLEFLQLRGDEAQVQDGMKARMIPVANLRAMLPTRKDDLVIPIVGDIRGGLLKIRKYGVDTCVARQPGKILKKGEVDASFATKDLVQVYPPLNRKNSF